MKANKVVAAIVAAIVALAALYWVERCCRRQPAQEACHFHCGRTEVEDGVGPILDGPMRFPLDGAQIDAIQSLFDKVSIAFSNCEYEVIVALEDVLPQKVERLHDKDFAQVTAGLYGLLSSEFSGKQETLRRFAEVRDFSARAKTDIAAMRLYGKARLRRKSGGEVSCRLEALALKLLNGYREMFVEEGRAEFVAAADSFIAEWIEHIESPQGFSRAEALYWLEYSRKWGQDAYGKQQEWDTLRKKAIRRGAEWLIRVGYTPQWIDELR